MAKVRYTMRFYRVHDLDIVTFIETHEFNISHAMYSALSAFSRGEVFVIRIPPRRKADLPQLRRVYSRALILDTEKDAKAISILSLIKPGYRNSFLKNLLRQYLCFPLSEEFLDDQDTVSYFDELFSVFRENKRTADAGSIKKEKDISKDSEKRKKTSPKKAKPEKAEEKPAEKEITDFDFGNPVPEDETVISSVPDAYADYGDDVMPESQTDDDSDEEVNSLFDHILGSE